MSQTRISTKNQNLLWATSAGRCQYEGCNKVLHRDILTKRTYNSAYIAHIVADKPNGPRGDAKRSNLLCNDINNLMLLCDKHHRLIDKEDVEGHPESRLIEMKRKHEERIMRITDIAPDKLTHIILYGANIGINNSPLSYQLASEAILPDHFPAEDRPIELGFKNNSLIDGTATDPTKAPESNRRYVYGLRGIMQLFNVSNMTAQRYKNGIIKDAVKQYGRKIVVDADLALELFAAAKEEKKA